MPIDRITSVMWWRYLDAVAHKLQADNASRQGVEHRTPANPRHTADVLKGEAMIYAAEVDEICIGFALTRAWPDSLSGDQLWNIQHRLGCAKGALEFMTTEGDHETAVALQSCIPDPDNESRFLECLLVPVWRLLCDDYLDAFAGDLMTLLTPEQRAYFEETDPPLSG